MSNQMIVTIVCVLIGATEVAFGIGVCPSLRESQILGHSGCLQQCERQPQTCGPQSVACCSEVDTNEVDTNAEPKRPSSEIENDEPGPLDGIILGSVTDPKGNPVAGVRFSARPCPTPREVLAPLEAARVAREDDHNAKALTRTATSDESGHFVFRKIGEGSYVVSGEAPPFTLIRPRGEGHSLLASVGSESLRVEPNEANAEFTAYPAAIVRLSVIDSAGEEPALAAVVLDYFSDRIKRGALQHAWTPTNRDVLMPTERPVRVVARTSGYCSKEVDFNPVLGQVVEATLPLSPRHGIRGEVFGHDGRLLPEGWIRLAPASGRTPPTRSQAPRVLFLWDCVRSGQFECLDLEPGDYWIAAGPHQDRMSVVERVTVEGIVQLSLTLPSPDLAKGVLIYSQAPDGTSISELEFSLIVRTLGGSSDRDVFFIANGDGGYYLDLSDELDISGTDNSAEITIEVTSPKYGSRTIALSAATLGRFDLQFEMPGFVELLVPDVPPELSGQIQALLTGSPKNETWSGAWTSIPPEGRVRLGPKSPGPARVLLGIAGSRRRLGSTYTLATQAIQVPSGDQSITMLLPPIHALTVRFPVRFAGRTVSIEAVDESTLTGDDLEIGADGKAHFPDLLAGKYRLKVFGLSIEMMVISVPQESVVEFQPIPVNALEVTINDNSHSLFAQGFRTGDLIVAFDGKAFESSFGWQWALSKARKRERVPVIVLRGNSEISLEFDAKSAARNARGARVQPTTR